MMAYCMFISSEFPKLYNCFFFKWKQNTEPPSNMKIPKYQPCFYFPLNCVAVPYGFMFHSKKHHIWCGSNCSAAAYISMFKAKGVASIRVWCLYESQNLL